MSIEYERSKSSATVVSGFQFASSDFLNLTPQADIWAGAAVNSGQITNVTALNPTVNHPGIQGILSSSTPDSGYKFVSSVSLCLLLGGGEESNFIFSLPAVVTTVTSTRLGFQDSTTATAPVDGMYIDIVDTTLQGICVSNSSVTATASTYTLVAETWYRVNITLNAAATLATFTLYSEAGAVLWTDTVATNIPTGAGRFTGHGIVSTNSGTLVKQLITLDYMDIRIDRILVR